MLALQLLRPRLRTPVRAPQAGRPSHYPNAMRHSHHVTAPSPSWTTSWPLYPFWRELESSVKVQAQSAASSVILAAVIPKRVQLIACRVRTANGPHHALMMSGLECTNLCEQW